jgi:hypothetical protein
VRTPGDGESEPPVGAGWAGATIPRAPAQAICRTRTRKRAGHAMISAGLLILSGILIGAGVSLIARDLRLLRRGPLFFGRSAKGLRTPRVASAIAAPAVNGSAAPSAGAHRAEGTSTGQPSLAEQWAVLAPMVEAAVTSLNALLARDGLALGESHAADWSYRQRGYGAYRRLLLAGNSIAWLRLELTAEGKLQASVRAHGAEHAAINASAERTAAGLGPQQLATLLLECLRPATGNGTQDGKLPNAAPAQAWQPGEENIVVDSALKATNGALAVAGARIVPEAAETDSASLAGTRPSSLRVEVGGQGVASMRIALVADAMEVAVVPRDARLTELGRRRRLPLEGMTIHALAETIAGCAWPAIAHHTDVRPRQSP